ncbi:ABC-2 transporter permease [Clostridium ljungdahlii]|uniref:ABC-2 family transporter protein n=1 Tax=Clostridium ljungdahlii TaxID=1538 RepID=A0A168MLH8_9CLOT|nr:ABC-2 transporter permease [Clostridium ljungdahlii]OAA84861.1 ABC-2 family transporter protein [Clostridium ljungdahlii]
MRGLILKDLYNLKKTSKFLIIWIVGFGVLFFQQNNMAFLDGFVVILASMLVTNTITYDNMVKWDKYALTMPVTRRDVVLSKYLVSTILSLIGAGIAVALCFAQGIYKHNLDMVEIFEATGLVLAVGFLFISIVLPVIYKFGVEKSRIVIFLVFFLAFAGITGISRSKLAKLSFSPLVKQYMDIVLQYLPFIMLIMTILIMIASYCISVKVYGNKDM